MFLVSKNNFNSNQTTLGGDTKHEKVISIYGKGNEELEG
jgi:hypothetical protein